MNRVQCFLVERLDLASHSLRRYCPSDKSKCPLPYGYHNASVLIAEAEPFDSKWEGDGTDDFDHADPRWPKACACGYEFAPDDAWQFNRERLYRDPRSGTRFEIAKAPPGAMWFAPWYVDFGFVGPDGQCLIVQLPDGNHWIVDGRANNSPNVPGWTRTGTPPNVTANPSILSNGTPGYHGFLRNGWLEEC